MAVEFKDEEDKITCSSEKYKAGFSIVKIPDGYGHWGFQIDKGQLPPKLQGRFTSRASAKEAFRLFDLEAKITQAAKNELLQGYREAKNAAAETAKAG